MSEPKSNIDYIHMINEQMNTIVKLKADNEIMRNAIENELRRCGGVIPILKEALKKIDISSNNNDIAKNN
jgi:hypothetical protein